MHDLPPAGPRPSHRRRRHRRPPRSPDSTARSPPAARRPAAARRAARSRTYTVQAGRHRHRPRRALPRLDRRADLPQPPRQHRTPARRPADRDPGGARRGPRKDRSTATPDEHAARPTGRPRRRPGQPRASHPGRAPGPPRDRPRRPPPRRRPAARARRLLAGVRLADAPRLQRRRDRRDAGAARRPAPGCSMYAGRPLQAAPPPRQRRSPGCCCSASSTTTPARAGTRSAAYYQGLGAVREHGLYDETQALRRATCWPSASRLERGLPAGLSGDAERSPRRDRWRCGAGVAAAEPYDGAAGSFPVQPRRPEDQASGRAQSSGTCSDPLVGRLLDGRYRIGPRIARGGMATRLRGHRHPARPHRRGQDHAPRAGRRRRVRGPLRARGPRAPPGSPTPTWSASSTRATTNGTVFLAMEYVPGHTLRDVIRKESPMPPAKALALLEPVLSALAAAHRAGLIHRDIKPENVLIADDGRVKVADFGLAKAVSADTQHTATGGVLIGTVSYLAPELVVDGRADARADVYAAGVVLYELLTGRKPHEGDSPIQVAYKHVHEDVPPPSALVPGLPAYVDALVARATARDRSQRPADARVLLHQVHRVRPGARRGRRRRPRADRRPAPAAESPSRRTEPELERPRRPSAPTSWHSADAAPAPHDPRSDVRAGHRPPERYSGTSRIERRRPSPVPRAARPPPVASRPWQPPRRGAPAAARCCCWSRCCSPSAAARARGTSASTATPAPPACIGLDARPRPRPRSRRPGWTFEVDDPAYSETVPGRRGDQHRPRRRRAGPRRRHGDGGRSRSGSERYDGAGAPRADPRTRPRTRSRTQPRVRPIRPSVPPDASPRARSSARNPKAGTPLKPGAAVDLLLSQRPAADQDRRLDRQGRRPGRGGARASKGLEVRPQRGVQRQRRRGRRHLAEPEHRHALQGRQDRARRLPGPELVEVPGVVGHGRRRRDRASSRTLGFEVEVRQHRRLPRPRLRRSAVDPGGGDDGAARAARSPLYPSI